MKKKILLLISLGAIFPQSVKSQTQPQPQPLDEDTVWMARAMVAEADFKAANDHAALGYVLLKRFKIVKKNHPEATLTDMIRAYCSGFKKYYRTYKRSPRLQWVYNLDPEGNEPLNWPKKLSWETYRPMWATVLERAKKLIARELKDPCRGRAIYWGGPMDNPSAILRRVDCGKTHNYFYAMRHSL